MDTKIKTRWLEALRSGRYRQGEGHLRQNACYCCLGVLCKVMGTEAYESNGLWYFGNTADRDDDFMDAALPESVIRTSGMFDKMGLIPDLLDRDGQPVSLANLNDIGFTFDQISDLIEYFL